MAGSMAAAPPALALGLPVPVPSAAKPLVPGLRQEGLYTTMPVTVDGVSIFRIATLTAAPTGIPIDMRSTLIENAIGQVLEMRDDKHGTKYEPRTFRVTIEKRNDGIALAATDAHHTSGAPLLTVTSVDAQYNKMPVAALAAQWQAALQDALATALDKRQPAEIKENSSIAVVVALVLATLTALGMISFALLGRRKLALEKLVQERRDAIEHDREEGTAVPESPEPEGRRRFLALAVRAAGPEQRLSNTRLLRSFIVWLLVLLWAVGITWALLLFPQTTALGRLIMASAIGVAYIWIGAGVLDRIFALIIARIAHLYSKRGDTSEDRARHLLRAPTITRAVGGFKSFLIVFIAILATASVINIPIASVVTVGGIVALAISFAAQNLVRDVFNGLLVLFEDQYVVGDYIMIGDYNGIVENLTLRIVQIRDGRGHLVTIPHSAVVQVVNASRNWSRVDYRIAVDPEADVKSALHVLSETLAQLGKDRKWRKSILKPVEWIGVETLSKGGIVLRAAIRTAPLRQFEVRREINDRVAAAFAEAKIAFGQDPLGPAAPPSNASPDPT